MREGDINARISNIRHSYKDLEWILLVGLANAAFYIPLDFGLSLLAMATVIVTCKFVIIAQSLDPLTS